MKKKEDSIKVKSIGPYDIINMIFKDPNKFNSLSNLQLEKNFFMINRVMSIKYPAQAQCFNHIKINPSEVIKIWATFLSNKEQHGKIPGFVFTKGNKKTSDNLNIKEEIKKSDILEYAKHYNLSLKDVEDLKEFCYDDLKKDIENLNKILSLQVITKNKN